MMHDFDFAAWAPQVTRSALLCILVAMICVSASIARAHGAADYSTLRTKLVKYARNALGTPYVWGGASPDGFDCSGLVQYSYRKVGVLIPRTVLQQLAVSAPLNMRQLRPGDLLFFATARGQHHVGIYVGDGKFIHAPRSGKDVMISGLSNPYWRAALLYPGRLLD